MSRKYFHCEKISVITAGSERIGHKNEWSKISIIINGYFNAAGIRSDQLYGR